MIPIYTPSLTERSKKYAIEAIESGYVSYLGKYREKAQDLLCELLKIKHALVLNSGTAACYLMGKIANKLYPSSSVFAPNNVYVAAWNGFIDHQEKLYIEQVDPQTWNRLPTETHIPINSVLLVVHNIGNTVNIRRILRCRPDIHIFEDACEALSGSYENTPICSYADCGALSFFANKTITSGEGGALVTNNYDIYEYAKLLHGQGQSKQSYIHSEQGYNYRMTNVQAALLCGQLEDIKIIREQKKNVFDHYKQAFHDHPQIKLQLQEADTVSENWIFAVRLLGSPSYAAIRDYLNSQNIECRPLFYPVSVHKFMTNRYQLVNGEETGVLLSRECVMLPSYPTLERDKQNHVINAVRELCKQFGDRNGT